MISLAARRSISRAAAAAVAVFLLVSAVPSPDRALIRIDKAGAERLPAGTKSGLFVVKELATSLLAVGPASLRDELAASGISAEVLDEDTEGKSYFLVRTQSLRGAGVLKRFGTAVPLDARTCLFWSKAGEAREILPPGYRIKWLALDRRVSWGNEGAVLETGPGPAEEIVSDPRIFEWVAKVSKTNLTAAIQSLQNFQTRYTSTIACEDSGTFLFNAFSQTGLACEYESFTFSGAHTTRNIIATLPGKANPGKVVIVCAHYDSYSNQAVTLAPGADDNASGTAAVLEIARVLAPASFDYTIKFICFSAEEWGLYGSGHYAQKAKARQENIVGVVNMDMIAFTTSNKLSLEVYVNSASDWLGARYLEAAATYAPMSIVKVVDPWADWSDHSSFWDRGYSALCGIEQAADWNPHYHRTTDTLDKLNMDFALAVTRASLAATADFARPYGVRPQPPTGLESRSRIAANAKTATLKWNAGPAAVVGYNVYRSTTSGRGYGKVNAGLLTKPRYVGTNLDPATAYFFVVTAVNGQGWESDYSAEVRDDQNNEPRPLPPTGLEARSQIVSSLFASVKTVFLQWEAGPATVAGYNVYRSTASGEGYEKVNSELLTQPLRTETMLTPGTTYFYVVTAVDGLGWESAYSGEVRDDQNNMAS